MTMRTGIITNSIMETRSVAKRRRGRLRRKWLDQLQEIGREKKRLWRK